eukprot:1157403-Pelagomonas_calceolata.AAC.8
MGDSLAASRSIPASILANTRGRLLVTYALNPSLHIRKCTAAHVIIKAEHLAHDETTPFQQAVTHFCAEEVSGKPFALGKVDCIPAGCYASAPTKSTTLCSPGT